MGSRGTCRALQANLRGLLLSLCLLTSNVARAEVPEQVRALIGTWKNPRATLVIERVVELKDLPKTETGGPRMPDEPQEVPASYRVYFAHVAYAWVAGRDYPAGLTKVIARVFFDPDRELVELRFRIAAQSWLDLYLSSGILKGILRISVTERRIQFERSQ